MHTNKLSVAAFAMFVGVVSLGCAGPVSQTSGSSGTPIQNLNMTAASNFKFEPATLVVENGKPVHLTLKNPDVLAHDVTLENVPAKDVKSEMGPHAGMANMDGMVVGHAEPGQTAEIYFTPTEKGTYAFYCSEPGHRQAGMQGSLQVQ